MQASVQALGHNMLFKLWNFSLQFWLAMANWLIPTDYDTSQASA